MKKRGAAAAAGGGGSSGRGGGSAPHLPRSNLALAGIATFKAIMRDEQQQFQPVAGGATCDKCTAARRNLAMTTGPAPILLARVASAWVTARPLARTDQGLIACF